MSRKPNPGHYALRLRANSHWWPDFQSWPIGICCALAERPSTTTLALSHANESFGEGWPGCWTPIRVPAIFSNLNDDLT